MHEQVRRNVTERVGWLVFWRDVTDTFLRKQTIPIFLFWEAYHAPARLFMQKSSNKTKVHINTYQQQTKTSFNQSYTFFSYFTKLFGLQLCKWA